jgi:transcriptional regulator with XRE-family HTH domain
MTMIKPLAETLETVTLRRKDFQTLLQAVEDVEDLAAVKAHRAHEDHVGWETAKRDYLTSDEVRRLLDEESPVRVWRKKRGMNQRALAEAAQVAVSYLAEIEAGKKPGSADALQRIANVLEVPMEDLAGSVRGTAGLKPVTRSEEAAHRLAKLAEETADRDALTSEAKLIVSEWLEIAERDNVRHQVKAAIGTLESLVTGLSTAWARAAAEQDGISDAGAKRRMTRISDALEAAIDALGEEYSLV